jgi:hypothetical protein
MAEAKQVVDLLDTRDAKCVGFAPVHPIYCKNLGPISLFWDFKFLQLLPEQTPMAQLYRDQWKKTAELIISNTADFLPKIITHEGGSIDIWQYLFFQSVITEEQYNTISEKYSFYQGVNVGNYRMLVNPNRIRVREEVAF